MTDLPRVRNDASTEETRRLEMAEKMDAISMLEEDHKKVKGLFRDYEKAGDNAHSEKRELYATIRQELEVHSALETEIFYPAVEGEQGEDVAEAVEEHQVIERLLTELGSVEPSDAQFDAKMSVLMENVEHHAEEEEEKKMFPKAKKDLGMERLREVGEQMQQRKTALQSGREQRRSAA
jgi:Hemerythrin HHE cation binding domain